MEVMQYCLGFFFEPDFKRVLLIRKNKPEWQKGKLNGIGGKLELSELNESSIMRGAYFAMSRELKEETGLNILVKDIWRVGAMGQDGRWNCEIFAGFIPEDQKPRTMESEEVDLYDWELFKDEMIDNLEILIPASIQKLKGSKATIDLDYMS